MKRLITAVVFGIVSVFVLSSVALATSPDRWSVSISTPANTTSKTFNVQYTTLSTGEDDDITVKLFQNGASVGSQTTTDEFGDSGVFAITVPSTGTYSYYIEAMNSTDGAPKTTGSVNVVVSEAPQAATTSATNTSSTSRGTAAGLGDTDGDGVVDDVNGDGVLDTAETKAANDRKLAAAAVKAASDDDDQADQDGNSDDDSNANGWYIAGGVAVLAGAGGYYLYSRRPKT